MEPLPADRSNLTALGWDHGWEQELQGQNLGDLVPARASRAIGRHVSVAVGPGPVIEVSSRRRDDVAVGDWVLVDLGVGRVESILPRRTAVLRRSTDGAVTAQVLAANIDVLALVHPATGAPNLRRIERELVVAWDSGAQPVVVLTKSDLTDHPAAGIEAVSEVAIGVEVLLTSAVDGQGVQDLDALVGAGRTLALIGPSGAGKSTLVNALMGEQVQVTADVREADGRGRHTTSTGQLLQLSQGGLLVDTPGLRAVGLWDAASTDGLDTVFADIAELGADCRFRDCAHDTEPGCAVTAAVADGALDPERFDSWRRLSVELDRLGKDRSEQERERRDRDRVVGKALRSMPKRP